MPSLELLTFEESVCLVICVVSWLVCLPGFLQALYRLNLNTEVFNQQLIKFANEQKLDKALSLVRSFPSAYYCKAIEPVLETMGTGVKDSQELEEQFRKAVAPLQSKLSNINRLAFASGLLALVGLAGAATVGEEFTYILYGCGGLGLILAGLTLKTSKEIPVRSKQAFRRLVQGIV